MTAARHLRFSTDPALSWTNVTPQMAKEWLDVNESNRNIRSGTIEKYARDMLAGAWDQTAEPIKFAPDGRLLDGQHRLKAIVKADVTVRLLVATGVRDAAQKRMDTGDKRTAADALGMAGVDSAPLVSAVARLALSVALTPERIGRFDASHDDILTWVEDHPHVRRSALFTWTVANYVDCPPSLIAYTHLMLSQINSADASDFWTATASHVAAYEGDPVIALARRFSDARRDRERISKPAQLSMVYRAWNYRRSTKPLRIIKVTSAAGGLIPVPVPK